MAFIDKDFKQIELGVARQQSLTWMGGNITRVEKRGVVKPWFRLGNSE